MWLDLDSIFDPDGGRTPAEPAPPRREETPEDLPPDWHFEWDERAAIMEYEGGLPRERAEALALQDILARMRGGPPPVWGEVQP